MSAPPAWDGTAEPSGVDGVPAFPIERLLAQASEAPAAGAPAAGAPAGGDAMEQVRAALGQLGEAFQALLAVLPEWATLALVALSAALLGILVGVRISRRRAPRGEPAGAEETTPAPPRAEAAAVHAEKPAFGTYARILEKKGVPAKEQDTQMREFAGQFENMRVRIRELSPGDAALQTVAEEAQDALDAGDFERTVRLLDRIAVEDGGAGEDYRKQAETRLVTASKASVLAGDLKMVQMEYGDATRSYQRALAHLPDGSGDMLAEFLNKHGTAAYQAGNLDAAAHSFERALDSLERTLGENHPEVATALNNLALLYFAKADFDKAEPLYKRSLAIDEKALGEDHPGVATDLNNLALLYKKQGNLDAAEPLLKRALTIKETYFDPGHPSLVTGLKNYASLLHALGRNEEATRFEARAAALPPKRAVVAAE